MSVNTKAALDAIISAIEARGVRLSKEPAYLHLFARNLPDICKFFGLDVKQIKGPSRVKSLARPRQYIGVFARLVTTGSFPEIGNMLGGRDHTTVMHAVNKIAQLIRQDPAAVNPLIGLRPRRVTTLGQVMSLREYGGEDPEAILARMAKQGAMPATIRSLKQQWGMQA